MRQDVVFNGISIGPETNLVELLKHQLLEGSLLAGRLDDSPEQGIWSLVYAAKGTAVESRLLDAMKLLAADQDRRVRAGAIGLVQHYAERFDASALLSILQSNANYFETDPDLTNGLLRALAGSHGWTPEVNERLRRAVLSPDGSDVLAGVVTNDAEWLIDNAPIVIGQEPNRARIILFRLKRPSERERLIRAIPRESASLRKIVRDAVIEEVKDKAEQDKLLKLLSA